MTPTLEEGVDIIFEGMKHAKFLATMALFSGMTMIWVGCEDTPDLPGTTSPSGLNTPSLRVPDLATHPELDPLKITKDNVGLVNFMDPDSLDLVLDELQSYFHDQNIGNWDGLFHRFPNHMYLDTVMMSEQRAMMEKWFFAGLRNRTGGVHLRYMSPWLEEEMQYVALMGIDLNFFLDFFDNFEGNPEGMKLSLQDQYGKDALMYHEFDQIAGPDTSRIRQWEVNAPTFMYALWAKDSTYCTFIPSVFDRAPFANQIMDPETKLYLLRHKREHFDKPE